MASEQKKNEFFLDSRYAKARKFTTLTVKMSKMQSLENFGLKLDSSYWEVNKLVWQTIRRLRGNKSNIARSIKD